MSFSFCTKYDIMSFMNNITVKETKFGTLCDGTEVSLYTISNGIMSFSCSNYGCTITNITVPSSGKKVDILMGCSTFSDCASSMSSYGTIVGRFANRIGGAKFSLNGKTYSLDKNDGENCLHGGFDRYEKKVYDAKIVETERGKGIEFSRMSPSGEQGFPGNVKLRVIYTLNSENELALEYFAETDEPTPINLTNHAYFNLKGYDGGKIYDLELKLNSSSYVEVGSDTIPTGKIVSVHDAPAFDFTAGKDIGKDIGKVGRGYDHAFCVDGYDGSLKSFGTLSDKKNGVSMEVLTTLPACQVYTGNYCEGNVGKNGFVHKAHDAICLETEFYPDAPNHPEFPDCIATQDKPHHSLTVYKFSFC